MISIIPLAEAQIEDKSLIPLDKTLSREEIKQKYQEYANKIDRNILQVIASENPSEIAKKLNMNFKDDRLAVYVYLNEISENNYP